MSKDTEVVPKPVNDTTENHVAIRAGLLLAEPKQVATLRYADPYAIVPEGCHVENLKDQLLTFPRRTEQAVVLYDVPSFIAYVQRYSSDVTVIFANLERFVFLAVLDYHARLVPAWCAHRAMLTLRQTDPWETWIANDGKAMGQAQFASFLEDNLVDISRPPGGEILEVVRTLELKNNVRFSSSLRLQDGQTQLIYTEDIEGSAARGTLQIPEAFTLGLAPFEASDKYAVTARLRYRMQEGKLTLWYNLLNDERILEDAFRNEWKAIEAETHVQVFAGKFQLRQGEADPFAGLDG